MLQLEFAPEGLAEQAGDKLGAVRSRTKGDMQRFKSFIESRGVESGGWRGDVPRFEGDVPRFEQETPRYGQDTPQFGQDAPRYEQDAPRYGQDVPPYEQDTPRYEQ